MPLFRLHHQHEVEECAAIYAVWKGFESPLRGTPTLASCREGGHTIWWDVDASDSVQALELLPPYVARRTNVYRVSEVAIP
jgi:hypothetical protein